MSDLTDKFGCGVFNVVFGRRPRRSVSTGSLPNVVVSFEHSSSLEPPKKKPDRIIARPSPNRKNKATPPLHVPPQQQEVKKSPFDVKVGPNGQKVIQTATKKGSQWSTGISGELEAMIDDHQRSNYGAHMKVYGNLGNLRQANSKDVDYHQRTNKEERSSFQNGTGNSTTKPAKPTSYCRALSTRMDPEQLKIMGNEDYKNGRFAEALSLYEAAISINPEKASYRSNKSAALTSLGRLLEAVYEAKEAIRIEPFYERAHNRLATLYLRLGDADKTIHHYKQAGSEADPDLIKKAQNLRVLLSRCHHAKKQRDWNTMVKESSVAISVGADSALEIYAMKAEGLLKMHRFKEADQVLSNAPKFEVDDCTKFYGEINHANMLVIWAQVDLAAGRIDDAMEAAQMAAKMGSNNKDVNMMVHRTRAVMCARSKGNDFFKAAKYSEACIAYGEGLDHDPFNSVLLCNRAACRTKLGEYEKAIEDCTLALNIRPSYRKARFRRADCNAKLGNLQASIEDYEALIRESPEDEEVSKALRDAKDQLKRQ